jgi:hypothetical protein
MDRAHASPRRDSTRRGNAAGHVVPVTVQPAKVESAHEVRHGVWQLNANLHHAGKDAVAREGRLKPGSRKAKAR